MTNYKQITVGLAGLFAGTAVYLISRPFHSVYFLHGLKSSERYFHSFPNFFGAFAHNAPAFFHPLSFSLVTMGLLAQTRKSRFMICLFWFSVNILFEVGQNVSLQVSHFIPHWFEQVPLLSNTKNFFLFGTFDICDIIAIFLGSVVAFAVSELTSEKGVNNEDMEYAEATTPRK